jgi:pimeloyl-ACP methyl ester carboxylesterase
VVPQDEPLGLNVARDAQHALDLIFDRCAAEPACAAAFPDLRGDFARVAGKLKQAPVAVSLNHPRTGELMQFTFTYDHFANTVRFLSYAAETAALLPLLIHSASANGDYHLLAADAILLSDQLSESISLGMNAAVLCSEDAPFVSTEQAAVANEGTYLGSSQTDQEQALCAAWPAGVVAPGFKEPVSADTPVLLLSGEADPVTPPENAARVARTLPNSLSLIAPGQGHNVIQRGCLPDLAAQFIDSGSVANLSTACVDQIEPWPFFINFAGMGP